MLARTHRRSLSGPGWWRLPLTLMALAAIVASACAPAAPPPAPTTAPAKPAAAAPTTAPAPAPTAAQAAKPAAPAAAATTAPAPAATSAPAAKPSEALKVVLGGELTSFDPTVDIVKSSIVIQNTIVETLAMNTPDQKFTPWLAESWEATNPTTWRIKLRKNVKFSNGEPFNADAVIFSLRLYHETKGPPRGLFSHIDRAVKVDDTTLDFITKEPSAILPSTLGFLYMLPPKYYQEVGTEGFGKKPIGTGPFKLVEWVKGVQLKVTANADYWGKKPAVGEIQFRWAPEASSRVAMLETGETHLAQNIPPAMIERVEKSGTARVEVVKSIRKVFLQMNISEGPTKDVRVRKALNHAIDVESIIKTLFKGRAYGRDKGTNLEGMEGYRGDQLKAYTYDTELAKKLIAEAGFPNGFEVPFWHPIGRYMLDKESSEAMAAQFAKAGVKTELRGMEVGAYFGKLNGEIVPGINYFACGSLFMNPLFCSTFHFQPGAGAPYGANERTAAYIKEASSTLDDAKRIKVIQEFENYVFDDHVPWVWLWHQQDIYGVSNKVNWKARSDELITFEALSFK